jgi:glycosyltransferase involved in cell wall biosynthesis
MKSLVSCIVPVYNGERHLGAALDSILAQTHRPIQVIVADDGSTDGTANVAASYADEVQYVRQQNRGPATARNLGLGAATGQFIGFLDADDLWHPEKLARQMARFVADPQLDYCVTHILNFWEEEVREEAELMKEHPRSGAVPGYVTGTLLARSRLFDAIGRFDEQLAHGDATDWFLRARAAAARGELMQDVLSFRRMHHTNRSRKRAASSQQEFLDILKANLDRKRASGR